MLRIALLVAAILASSLVVSAQSDRSDNWIDGVWEGTGYQIDDGSLWTMRFTARAGTFAIEYPSLKCGGIWRVVSLDHQMATFIERLSFGKTACTDDGNIVIERLSNRQLAFRYSMPNTTDVTASGILKKNLQKR